LSRLKSYPPWLDEYVEAVDSRVSALSGDGESALEVAVKEAVSGGKRVRAVLSLLWCEGLCGNASVALPVSVAYELAHAAALVQDDILDESESRRGEKSIVKKHGMRSAILASNMLLAQVPSVISEYGLQKSGGRVLRKLFELLGDAFGATIMGEFMDLEMARRDDVAQKDYEYMIRLKTGALIGASSASGVVVGGGLSRDETMKAAYAYGEWIGMAYQVQDDLLDIIGDERRLGKPIFADIRGGKKNAVLIHVMEKASKAERAFVQGLFKKSGPFTDSDVVEVKRLLGEYGSVDHARRLSASYVNNARHLIENLELGEARKKLLDLSDFLVQRKY